ncbi:MAG: prepilin-type N-terminal cleavage/methylation domain-containing protein [Lentisphaeria bacterium]|nr:prepilin-type N-terminal cleavage/methylation domain-containing protein [Lentisphaeria bacterium]
MSKQQLSISYAQKNLKESRAGSGALSPASWQVKLYSFTLIELLVSSAISSWHFFTRKSAYKTQQRSPLFLKEKGGAGERENFFSREKKFSLSPAHSFTLIELLVVIAIIAILAAILLPALNSARERGRQASCVSNLKTLGTQTTMYADAFDDYVLPHSMSITGNTLYYVGALYSFLHGYTGVATHSFPDLGVCPSTAVVPSRPAGDLEIYPVWYGYIKDATTTVTVKAEVTYSYNRHMMASNGAVTPPRKRGTIQQPSQTVMFQDNVYYISGEATAHAKGFDPACTSNVERDINRHQGNMGIGWCDGSVGMRSIKEMWTPTGTNRHWLWQAVKDSF